MDRHHFYRLTYSQLYDDLMQAYIDARRHKRNKPYQIRFENNLEANLTMLCDELWNRMYSPLQSACFFKPHRKYVNNTTLNRMRRILKTRIIDADIGEKSILGNSIVSCLGVLSHYKSNPQMLLGI